MCVYMPVWCMHAVYSDCIIYVHKAYVSVHVVCIYLCTIGMCERLCMYISVHLHACLHVCV